MTFPVDRPRRLRASPALRKLVREIRLHPASFVLPIFVVEDPKAAGPIGSMPGVTRVTADGAVALAAKAAAAGVGGVLLFGIPLHKDAQGSSGWDDNGPVPTAVRKIKAARLNLVVMTDVCMCEYTDHGHCGVLVTTQDGAVSVDNDPTLDLLAKEALAHARAGADVVAPSDMMDGRIAHLRHALDEQGFAGTAIMSYAAKYASAFYGPFRDAAESTPSAGDRKTYQMDPANQREAVREVSLDLAEGADIVMVKPALPYLDIIANARAVSDVPVAAYNVSGEYTMLKLAAAAGAIDENRAILEVLTSIQRAGADIIITYHAIEAAVLINEGAVA